MKNKKEQLTAPHGIRWHMPTWLWMVEKFGKGNISREVNYHMRRIMEKDRASTKK